MSLRAALLLTLPLLDVLAGCSEPPPPQGQWRPRYEDNTPEHPVHGDLPPPKKAMDVEVHRRDKPTRPFVEMAAIEIACPAEAQRKKFTMTPTVEIVGGCSYEVALDRARGYAAERGADGIYGVETTVAENGRLVHLLAIPYRYKPDAPAAP